MVNVKQHKVFPTIINEIQFDMDEQEQCWRKSKLYDDINNIAPTYMFGASEIYTIKRYLGNFF